MYLAIQTLGSWLNCLRLQVEFTQLNPTDRELYAVSGHQQQHQQGL
jgi:hypothetical protein